MHLSLLAVATAVAAATLLLPGCSAVRAAPGLILKALAGEELLLRSAERESHAAIRAGKSLVLELHG
jgi:hypothetical protein